MATSTSDVSANVQEPLFDEFDSTPTEDWEERIRQDLGERDYEETLIWRPEDDLALRAFYRREDLSEAAAPVISAGERTVAVSAALSARTPEAANEQAREAIEGGATSLRISVERDGTTWKGLPLFDAAGMKALLEGIELNDVDLHLHVADDNGRSARTLLGLLLEEVRRASANGVNLRGTVCFDPWASALTLGRLHVGEVFDNLVDLVQDAGDRAPELRTVGIDAQPYHEAGATTSREVACTLAAVSETLASLTERGVDPSVAVSRLHVIVPIGTSFFLEIAKLRALRHLLPQVTGAFSQQEEEAEPLIQAVTSRRTQTRYDAHMNMVRGATSAAAAVVGGADLVEVRPYDDASGTPSSFGQRIARNTALILRYESHLDHVTDPAAGAYYIETLTDKVAERAWSLFQEIEANGGLLDVLRSGILQHQIHDDRERLLEGFFRRERVLVGINHYPHPDEQHGDVEPPPTVQLSSTDNSIDTDAPEEKAIEVEALDRRRLAEPFEQVRIDTERHVEKTGHRPAVFLLPVGPPAIRSARATFARNVLGCAGFNLIEPVGFDSLQDGISAIEQEVPDIVVLCTPDDNIGEYGSALAERFARDENGPLLVVAGQPDEAERGALEEAGVEAFIHRGINLLDTLRAFQTKIGIETS